MFVRTKTTKNSTKTAVQIVESYRQDGKVRQRIVRHMGYALTDKELQELREVAEHEKTRLEHQDQPSLLENSSLAEMTIQARQKSEEQQALHCDLRQLREEERRVMGIHETFGKIYRDLGFQQVISNPSRHRGAVNNLFQAVMGRIAATLSKRATAQLLSEQYAPVGISDISDDGQS